MHQANRAERIAVSFPIAVAICGLIGWITQAWFNSQSQNQQQSQGRGRL